MTDTVGVTTRSVRANDLGLCHRPQFLLFLSLSFVHQLYYILKPGLNPALNSPLDLSTTKTDLRSSMSGVGSQVSPDLSDPWPTDNHYDRDRSSNGDAASDTSQNTDNSRPAVSDEVGYRGHHWLWTPHHIILASLDGHRFSVHKDILGRARQVSNLRVRCDNQLSEQCCSCESIPTTHPFGPSCADTHLYPSRRFEDYLTQPGVSSGLYRRRVV
jgi:hypothetical protein